jgi:hypothetical protein
MRKSVKQIHFEKKIISRLSGKPLEIMEYIISDKEIQILQDYANVVSIKRLGYNDHGPVHMRKAALNAVLMFDLLQKANIKFNLEKEHLGKSEDSKVAIIIAAMIHDIGMTVSRQGHEFMSVNLAIPIIERILGEFYNNDITKKVIMK